jgi:hypothetical protein
MKKLAVYKAFARKKHTNSEFVTTEIKAYTLKEAEEWFCANDYEIDGKVYLSYRMCSRPLW